MFIITNLLNEINNFFPKENYDSEQIFKDALDNIKRSIFTFGNIPDAMISKPNLVLLIIIK
jgi:hypothetical protein